MSFNTKLHLGSNFGFNSGSGIGKAGGLTGLSKIYDDLGVLALGGWSAENKLISGTSTTIFDYGLVNDMTNPAATNQATFFSSGFAPGSKPYFALDGIDDYFYKSVATAYGATGMEIHTVINPDSTSSIGFSSSDEATNSNFIGILGGTATRYFYNVWGGSNRIGHDSLSSDLSTQANIITVAKSSINTYALMLNTVAIGVVMDFGSNDGKFFSDIANRDNIAIGGRISLTPTFGSGKWGCTFITKELTTQQRIDLHNNLKGHYEIV